MGTFTVELEVYTFKRECNFIKLSEEDAARYFLNGTIFMKQQDIY